MGRLFSSIIPGGSFLVPTAGTQDSSLEAPEKAVVQLASEDPRTEAVLIPRDDPQDEGAFWPGAHSWV